jgi:hypothetical protein
MLSDIINHHQDGLQEAEPHLLLSWVMRNKGFLISDNHIGTGNACSTLNVLYFSLQENKMEYA